MPRLPRSAGNAIRGTTRATSGDMRPKDGIPGAPPAERILWHRYRSQVFGGNAIDIRL